MARFESEGTWFAAEEVAKRARRAGTEIDFGDWRALSPLEELRNLYTLHDRRALTEHEMGQLAQRYHQLVGALLAQPAPHAARLEEAEHRLRGLVDALECRHWAVPVLVMNARRFLAGDR